MNKEEFDQNVKLLKKRRWRELPLRLLFCGIGFAVFFLTGHFGAFLLGVFAAITMLRLADFLSSKIYEKWVESLGEKKAREDVQIAVLTDTVPKDNKEE